MLPSTRIHQAYGTNKIFFMAGRVYDRVTPSVGRRYEFYGTSLEIVDDYVRERRDQILRTIRLYELGLGPHYATEQVLS